MSLYRLDKYRRVFSTVRNVVSKVQRLREFERQRRQERDWEDLDSSIDESSESDWDGSINDVYEGLDDPPDLGPDEIA